MAQPGSKISQGQSYRELPNKAYQSTRAFDTGGGALYTYSTTVNSSLQTVGSLVINTGSSAGACPAGRVLHANGKVLVPSVHPGGGAGVTPVDGTGSTTPSPLPFPMIGVYDPVTGLNGYINPQNSTWALYDASLSAFYDNASTPSTTLGGQGAEPRFGAVFIGSATTTTPSFSTGAAHVGLLTCTTASVSAITVLNTEVTASSIILLTLRAASSTASLRVSALTAGTSFVITPSAVLAAGDIIHFAIIN